MKEICPNEQCTGCSACYAACQHNAINMVVDKHGFEYPVINYEKCIGCGLCMKSCPNNSELFKVFNHEQPECFVCHAKDSYEQLSSTSGGVASAISRLIIRRGGIVYGCCSQLNFQIFHIRVEKESDLELLKGSKYVQSKIGKIYCDVKKDLQEERYVLFIGTPCQVSGLRQYLKKSYTNLLTIDFVCHGVPSVQYLKDSIRGIDMANYKVLFRHKTYNTKKKRYDSNYGVYLLSSDNRVEYYEQYPHGLYILGYLNALFYRNCCYTCLYSNPKRVSDFTVGDYHDKENKYTKMSGHDKILSMLNVNTQKGKELIQTLRSVLDMSPCTFDTMLAKHEQMYKPMSRHENYNLFRDLYLKKGFVKAAKIALSKERRNIYKRMIKSFISKYIQRI